MRRLFFAPGLALLTSFPASAQSSLTTRLDSFFRTLPPTQPGIAVSIQQRGAVIYENTAGLANPNPGGAVEAAGTPIDSTTNFRMASVTKQFTAMAILLLEKDHRLSVEDPIGRWLPELPKDIGKHVLIRHLLTHSSGIEDYESLIPDSQTSQVLDKDVLDLLSRHDTTYFAPGTRFRYSNSGFCLLALIVERASRQSYAAYIKNRIFLPLQMDHSTVYEKGNPIFHRAMGFAKDSTGAIIPRDQSVTSATKGDGGIYTSLTDYRKWIAGLQQNRLIDLPAALSRLRFPMETPAWYAAGWFITRTRPRILYHSGSTCGFENQVIWIPGSGWSIVFFSNLAGNTAAFAKILEILDAAGTPKLTGIMTLEAQTR
ncbi:MAG TPA: serine hydrolase domain-containing protein [Puia sp.]|nr:serine hydrolase domain-containing protein [Puia sp.]